MPAAHTIMPFLNRIALMTDESPLDIEPRSILNNLRLFATSEEYNELFDQFCNAALDDHYSWNDGGPGNLLFVCERMEMLIEVSYLINLRHTKEPTNKSAKACLAFFKHQTLPEWKREFYKWKQAAFSDDSVANEVQANSIQPFIKNIKMLLEEIL